MKTVVITGASSGIGRASAKRFAAEGWNVVATMRTPTEESSDHVLVEPLDVTDPASITEAIAHGIERFGAIDAVVNNAGYGQYGPFEAVSPEKVHDQFDVNVFGPMNVMRAVLPHMRSRKDGIIVNVSSGAGLYALPLASLYCATKYALEGFSEAVSYELGSLGIRVKLVIPHGGVTDTNFGSRATEGGLEHLPDYDAYQGVFADSMARMPAPLSVTAADVAATVLGAVTDGTDQLRYLVGQDTRGFIDAWDTMTNDEYLAFMRRHFAA